MTVCCYHFSDKVTIHCAQWLFMCFICGSSPNVLYLVHLKSGKICRGLRIKEQPLNTPYKISSGLFSAASLSPYTRVTSSTARVARVCARRTAPLSLACVIADTATRQPRGHRAGKRMSTRSFVITGLHLVESA